MQDDSSLSSARPLRSRATTNGLDRAPHRAFLRAMGLNDEAIASGMRKTVGTMNVVLSDQKLAARRAQWRPAAAPSLGGTLEKYAAVVGPAHLGAVTHSGKVNWPYLLPS